MRKTWCISALCGLILAAPIAAGETMEYESGNRVPGDAGGDWRVSRAGPAGSVLETRVTVDTIGSRVIEIDDVETRIAQGKVICASQPLVVERQGVWYNPDDPRAQERDLFSYREKGEAPQRGRDAFLAVGFADPEGGALIKGGMLIKQRVACATAASSAATAGLAAGATRTTPGSSTSEYTSWGCRRSICSSPLRDLVTG